MTRPLAYALSTAACVCLTIAACGSPRSSSFAKGADGGPGADEPQSGPTLPVDPFGDGKGGADVGCVNLECQRAKCETGGRTTVSGRVFDPSGEIPLYNVIVFVPNAELAPLTEGIACERCGSVTSGSPVATAITGPDGTFVLNDVPTGDNIPLVIQIGKWRRKLTLPKVTACTDTVATNVRMPKTRAEGDLPRIAIATGSIDPFQCLLRKIGIADSEFTRPTEEGRLHLYQENGMGLGSDALAQTLYSNAGRLKTYDMVILPCAGADLNKSTADKERLMEYTAQGGRLFTTHFGYDWLRDAPAPWPRTARYREREGSFTTDPTGVIDTSFPKGADFAKWLSVATRAAIPGSNPVDGQFKLVEPRLDVDGVAGGTRQWVTTRTPESVQHFTFNTPVDAPEDQQCGRVVYSNFHVTNGLTSTSNRFPSKCDDLAKEEGGRLRPKYTPQELALVFMLFDLSSCIQRDDERPKPPPVK